MKLRLKLEVWKSSGSRRASERISEGEARAPPSHYGNGSPFSALNALKRGRGPASTRTTGRNLNRRGSSTRPSNSVSYRCLVRERNYLQPREFFDGKSHVWYSTHDFALLNVPRICKSAICKFRRRLKVSPSRAVLTTDFSSNFENGFSSLWQFPILNAKCLSNSELRSREDLNSGDQLNLVNYKKIVPIYSILYADEFCSKHWGFWHWVSKI